MTTQKAWGLVLTWAAVMVAAFLLSCGGSDEAPRLGLLANVPQGGESNAGMVEGRFAAVFPMGSNTGAFPKPDFIAVFP